MTELTICTSRLEHLRRLSGQMRDASMSASDRLRDLHAEFTELRRQILKEQRQVDRGRAYPDKVKQLRLREKELAQEIEEATTLLDEAKGKQAATRRLLSRCQEYVGTRAHVG